MTPRDRREQVKRIEDAVERGVATVGFLYAFLALAEEKPLPSALPQRGHPMSRDSDQPLHPFRFGGGEDMADVIAAGEAARRARGPSKTR